MKKKHFFEELAHTCDFSSDFFFAHFIFVFKQFENVALFLLRKTCFVCEPIDLTPVFVLLLGAADCVCVYINVLCECCWCMQHARNSSNKESSLHITSVFKLATIYFLPLFFTSTVEAKVTEAKQIYTNDHSGSFELLALSIR